MTKCNKCGTEDPKKMTDKVVHYSTEKYGSPVCFDCQRGSDTVKPTGETKPHEPTQKFVEESIQDNPQTESTGIGRERLIIRQNAMSNAADIVSGFAVSGKISISDAMTLYISLAEIGENWVYR